MIDRVVKVTTYGRRDDNFLRMVEELTYEGDVVRIHRQVLLRAEVDKIVLDLVVPDGKPS